MRWALSASSREKLRRFTASRVILVFDFDGTLSPIVKDPQRARLRGPTRLLLRRLSRAYTCVALSGRSRTDLRAKLEGTGVTRLIGNHGAEPWREAGRLRRQVAGWKRTLEAELPALPGLWIEDKGLSLTVHYRQCRRKREAKAAIADAARGLAGVRLVPGKEAVSLVALAAPNKGAALKAVLVRLNCGRALYVGDDGTDEDVFRLKSLPLFGIRVGRSRHSRADYFLRNQKEIDALIRLLLVSSSAR
jgi:trehalose 6-phosphate phosphatase